MSTIRYKWIILVVCLLLVLGGCGKSIPAINPALLDSKMSVLLISKPNLAEATVSTLTATLLSWRDTHHISFDWMANTEALQEQQLTQIKSMPYNYIIVIGNDLNRQILPLATTLTEKKWFFLDDAIATVDPSLQATNVSWKQTDEGFMEKQWNEWVKQQQVLGKSIEWVTMSSKPIPSLWAPSEEAETISLTDAQGWFPQFQNQVKQHGPSWIALYAPVDAASLQRIKALKVPIMDMASTSIEVQWSIILPALQQTMSNNLWAAGIQSYTPTEIQIVNP
ncbi:hypothetical protein [Paenibacillus agricola]|uniref:Uncharacterized protein n=1 Tax=Paenibacillus agricola TaxID=2716264 RepID=A0ABX0J2W6_9BACL|nr:hypothetical protein [Paenibacillus agricola]NHN28314.1 hypothetical protein [Paenibacillus agricola]